MMDWAFMDWAVVDWAGSAAWTASGAADDSTGRLALVFFISARSEAPAVAAGLLSAADVVTPVTLEEEFD